MGGIKYTDIEINYLKDNWNIKSIDEMAVYLNRDPRALGRKLSYLGFTVPKILNEYRCLDSYSELYAHTDTVGVIISKIDTINVEKLKKYTWNMSNTGYLFARVNKKYIALHRYILNINDTNVCIDHINQDKFDNRLQNLRLCTKGENNQNKFDTNKSSTGFRGVVLHKIGKMTAQVKFKGITIFLKSGNSIYELAQISSYARAFILPFSEDARMVNKEDIPQWIKDKIIKKLNSKGVCFE